MTLLKIIESDLKRLEDDITFKSFLKHYFFPRGEVFRYTVWLRILQYVKNRKLSKIMLPVVYLIFRHYEFKYGIHVNTNANIGEGLLIVHGDGVHLTVESIGKNVTVYQGVTCGVHRDGCPVLEDNVRIHPNAVVVGPIVVHRGAIIGANTYVDKDVEMEAVVIGIPSKRIR